MQLVANHLPLKHSAEKHVEHQESSWREKIDKTAGVTANLLATILCAWLGLWALRELWRQVGW